jgi:antitoxin (DNA-binding transcriptional repressor) of toxin-antitoxin stability system
METRLSVAELERDVEGALERVRDGGRVVVERDGAPIAVIEPPTSPVSTSVTSWRELAERLRDVPSPDDEFAADLEAIRAAQQPAPMPEWPD